MLLGTMVLVTLFIIGLTAFGLAWKLLKVLPSEWIYRAMGLNEEEIALPSKK